MTATRPRRGSVFLVEDEVMIRMMVADMLEELGYHVAAEAGEIGEAIRLVQCTDFDLAILDVNVNGKVISPVADLIKARNRPFIFATGYGSSGLPEEYRDRPALQKPFQLETLSKMIDTALKVSRFKSPPDTQPVIGLAEDGPHLRMTPVLAVAPISTFASALPKTPHRCGRAGAA